MYTGTHTNEHTAQHLKAGQGISMLQLIFFFNKDTLAASCAMGNEKKKQWPPAIKSSHNPGTYW